MMRLGKLIVWLAVPLVMTVAPGVPLAVERVSTLSESPAKVTVAVLTAGVRKTHPFEK